MRGVDIDIGKWGLLNTSYWIMIMKDWLHITSAIANLLKPFFCYWSKLLRLSLKPCFKINRLKIFTKILKKLCQCANYFN